MEELSLQTLFNDAPLYSKEKFEIFKLVNGKYNFDSNEFLKMKKYLGIGEKRLISYCHKCKKEFPFSIKHNVSCFRNGSQIYVDKFHLNRGLSNGFATQLDLSTGFITGAQPPYDENIFNYDRIWYFEYSFICTNNQDHIYMLMVSVELNKGSFIVRKIGQNPSMLTIKGFDFDKYKCELNEINAYSDYKKADLSFGEQFYVGSYAYLRRIFEKMVNKYLEGNLTKGCRMEDKITAIKGKFDPRIQNLLTSLYGILSISIHELEEEKSKEYYTYLKAIIDMQLEFEKTEAEKLKQSKELAGVLGKITSELGKK